MDVLIVEDEPDLALATADYLQAFGLTVQHVGTGEEGLAAVSRQPPGVLIVDVNLPGLSGFELCQQVRARFPGPIIVVSARQAEVDQVRALTLGADDYVTKPFSLAVLLAKVRRCLDRAADTAAPAAVLFDDGHLRIEADTGRTYLAGQELALTAQEDRLLRHLVGHAGAVCPKADITQAVWGDLFTSEGALSVQVRRLRTRIEPDPDAPTYVHTVRGRGYLFEAR
ncbi:response regulator transcription factor [Buchananella hordeovulneris]|uniref:response regulator transcription factor n=1 Tax=Buchananella hordeovulneris TaxID=52770 RepID=UPI000F5D6CDC|nr:response regulator transcription factor [Buchananella hordeovulneris]RRD43334.1 DNA-binding response regulator [Buchananella hordeovulneris]